MPGSEGSQKRGKRRVALYQGAEAPSLAEGVFRSCGEANVSRVVLLFSVKVRCWCTPVFAIVAETSVQTY